MKTRTIILIAVLAGLPIAELLYSRKNSSASLANALRYDLSVEDLQEIAELYLAMDNYSEQALTDALCEYGWCGKEKAKLAVSTMDVDWQEKADFEVASYLSVAPVSKEELRKYLEQDQFTEEQIDKALDFADLYMKDSEELV